MHHALMQYNFDDLRHLTQVIDQRLAHIRHLALQMDDPDSYGLFDDAEQLVGVGFVVCQNFITNVCGHLKIQKQVALRVGPTHSSGKTIVQIINSAANYWKHNGEWSMEENSRHRKIVAESFKAVGTSVTADYPLLNILTELGNSDKTNFKPLIMELTAWKDKILIERSSNKMKNP